MADYYCKCKGCKHIDPNERSGYKWYCTWYRCYEDPDRVHECRQFESQNDSSSCFLTSACCRYKGLPDNCEELMVLRHFRDTYLQSTEEGKQLVEEYYQIAPAIVEKIDAAAEKDAIYSRMYETICAIKELIERGEFDTAVTNYRRMVLDAQNEG